MRTDTTPLVRLEDYRPSDFLIDRVELDVRLHPTGTRVTATLFMKPNPEGRSDAPLVLDGDELNLKSVALNEIPLAPEEFEATPQSLTIPQAPRQPFTLTIETEINPTANTKLMGLYRSSGNYCTQCEAEGFRRITYFLDRPDVLSVYTTRIEADRNEVPVLLGNGNLVESGAIQGSDRHYAVWHDPHPKPSYLFALVGGRLGRVAKTFTTASGREVDLAIYVEPGKEDRADYALDALERSMRWDEEVFGCEYDLDVFNIVAVSDFNMGAMENKGLNIFNDKYVLASPETATDMDYAHIEAIIAHEYFHNWSGNRVTCRDWFQLCLKEGLTVFRDQEFSSDERSRPVHRIAEVKTLRARQFLEDASPLSHPVRPTQYREINNFYTATVYEKGAEIVRMLKTIIGDEDFRRGMDLYFERCDGTAATVEDFLGAFAEVTGRDLSHFARWYEQSGTPRVKVKGHYDPDAQTYRLDFAQSTPPTPGQAKKEPMAIPVLLGLVVARRLARRCGLRPGRPARRLPLRHGGRQHHLHRRDIPAGAVPVPGLLRPGEGLARSSERGTARPAAARHGCVQPLAGGADRRDAPAGGSLDRRSRSCDGGVAALSSALRSFMDRDALDDPGLCRARRHAPERGRHRAGDRRRTWTRMRSTAREPKCAAASAAPASSTCTASMDRLTASGGLQPRRGQRRAAGLAQCVASIFSRRPTRAPARRSPWRSSIGATQHDGPPGGARAFSRPCPAQSREAAIAALRGPLPQRAARARQMVHAPGRHPRGRHPRPGRRRSWSIPPSPSPIPTACAR